jgi:hypothetical protein
MWPHPPAPKLQVSETLYPMSQSRLVVIWGPLLQEPEARVLKSLPDGEQRAEDNSQGMQVQTKVDDVVVYDTRPARCYGPEESLSRMVHPADAPDLYSHTNGCNMTFACLLYSTCSINVLHTLLCPTIHTK